MTPQTLISLISVLLVLYAYALYFRDIFRGKTVPHMYTWLVFTLAVSITCALQILGGAGVGAWMTGVLAVVCFGVFLASFRYGTKDVTKLDLLFLALALVSLGIWLFAKQPVLSVVLIVTTDVLGLVPTVRKSWRQPYSETLFAYQITAFRHALSIFALQQVNILTVLYPIVWALVNAAFCVMLVVRRRKVAKPPQGAA